MKAQFYIENGNKGEQLAWLNQKVLKSAYQD